MAKSRLSSLTSGNTACFLANADESFILTTGSDVAAALDAPEYTSWLITSYNLGYTTALPLVRTPKLNGDLMADDRSTVNYAI